MRIRERGAERRTLIGGESKACFISGFLDDQQGEVDLSKKREISSGNGKEWRKKRGQAGESGDSRANPLITDAGIVGQKGLCHCHAQEQDGSVSSRHPSAKNEG